MLGAGDLIAIHRKSHCLREGLARRLRRSVPDPPYGGVTRRGCDRWLTSRPSVAYSASSIHSTEAMPDCETPKIGCDGITFYRSEE